MTDKAQEKQTLRDALRKQAAMLPAEYLASSNAGIVRQVQSLPAWQSSQMVFLYVSVRTEPDTHALIEEVLAAGKCVCVPCCEGSGVMHARQIAGLDVLRPARYGLLEPDESCALVPPGEIDLAVVPCVAADEKGHRLGNGAGYYDRYLARLGCPKACLCRGVLLQKRLPHEGHDVLMDAVVTEDGVYQQQDGW